MNEREKEIIQTIAEALPNMPEFKKGYLLGVAEGRVQERETEKKERELQKA